jgi:hypothetical protein
MPPKTIPFGSKPLVQNNNALTRPKTIPFGSAPIAPVTNSKMATPIKKPGFFANLLNPTSETTDISPKMSSQQFLSQPKIKQYAQAFVSTLPKDAYDFFIQQPEQFLKSIGEAIPTLASGGKNTPDYGGYVSQANKAIQGGEKPFGLKSLVLPSVETVGSGLATMGLGKDLLPDVNLATGETSPGAILKGAGSLFNKVTGVSDKEALDQTMSSLSKGEKQSVGKTGSNIFGGVKRVATDYEQEVSDTAQPFLSKNMVTSENNIQNEISRISKEEVMPGLQSSSYGLSQGVKTGLVDDLNNISPLDITKSDPVRNGAFNLFKERVSNAVANASNDEELFSIRQDLNGIADTQSGGKIWEQDTGKMNPTQEYWRQAYRKIGDLLKERNPQLADQLDTQSKLFDALEGVQEKTGKLIGKPTAIGKLAKGAAQVAGGAIIAGALGEGAVAGTKKLLGQ